VGQGQSPCARFSGQPPGLAAHPHRWHPGCRRCLLKGCERWFLPERSQARYCSPACRDAARRWRRWHAAQRYRATTHGKQRRRDQSRRYRSNRRQRSSTPEMTPASPDVEPEPPPPSNPPATPFPAGEGQRPGEIPEENSGLPCDRPGCYAVFLPTARSPQQHFCSGHCRQALRRVRQREARLRRRRRCGIRPRGRSHRGPPSVTSFMSSRIENPRS
jgi:hypothetical protein